MYVLVLDINHPLRMRVAKVALMRGPGVDLVLIQGVLDLIREDTRRKARDDLCRATLVRGFEDVVVDEEIVAQEGELRIGEPNVRGRSRRSA
jgi:hypothetical protein